MRLPRCLFATLTISAALPAVPARADAPPPPPPPFSAQEFMLTEAIGKAGYRCGHPISATPASGDEAEAYEKQGYTAYSVACSNGSRYLVAMPLQRPGPPPADPSGKPLPPPSPVVKPISQ